MTKLFKTDWFPAIVARIFAVRPTETIWEWADRDNVFLDATMAAEPGYYRSAKTPHTRRIQELCQRPWRLVRGKLVRVRKIVVKKSSQTGYTEAVLNVIRWFARFSPRNVIYAIDTAEEAANIRDRLANTLADEALTGDADDLKKLKLTLKHMLVWFYGSFSKGKFANKQAPFGVVDEAEQHENGKRSVGDVESRSKKSEEGLTVVISKPEEKDGVIDDEHSKGNQEIYLVPCPFCGTYQELTLEKLKFDHCKTLLDEWDLDRVLHDTAIECAGTYCKRLIPESYKHWMCGVDENNRERGHWFATHEGDPKCDPEVVSQEINDLYDICCSVENSPVSWGRLAIKIIQTKGDREGRKVVWTQNFARVWEEKQNKPEAVEVLRCRAPYRRGEIPSRPLQVLLGADVGKAYARWVVAAILRGARKDVFDIAIIDWGHELHPDAIAHIVATKTFKVRTDPEAEPIGIQTGLIDAKHRVEDTLAACMQLPGRLWPVMGGGGRLWRKSFGIEPVGNAHLYPAWLKMISFNDRDFKSELYLTRIKRDVPPGVPLEKQDEFRAGMPRLLVPENVTELRDRENDNLVKELCNEPFIEDLETGQMKFERTGANHYGDCVKEICVGWRWISRGGIPTSEPAEQAANQ